MKKTLVILAVLMVSALYLSLYGQNFGVQAGYNLSNIYFDESDEFLNEDFISARSGYHAGLLVEFGRLNALSVQTGAFFTSKGYRLEMDDLLFDIEGQVSLYYLEVPVMVNGNYYITPDIGVFLSAGPYAGYGLMGKTSATITVLGESDTEEEDIVFGEDVNQWDFGATFGAGVRLWMTDIGVNYDLGLFNTNPEEDLVIQNRVWRIYARAWF
jgi:hypothetical protein